MRTRLRVVRSVLVSALADRVRRQRKDRYGVASNWAIVGLTAGNTVQIEVDGITRDTDEGPSEWIDLDHLLPSERRILRRGLTRAGRDRASPLPAG